MIRLTRKRITAALLIAALLFGLIGFYRLWLSRTRIAFVNYQPIALQGISQANDNWWITLTAVSEKEVGKALDKYDIIFVNGMGLRIDASQREELQALANKGKPIYTSMATNPDNAISNFSVDETVLVQKWMSSGGRKNYQSLLAYLRSNIDGKIWFTGKAEKAEQQLSDYFYWPDTDREFVGIEEFEAYLKQEGLWHEGGQKLVVSGQITDPSDLVRGLAKEGRYNIYPLSTLTRLQEYVELIKPDALINLAHGRLGDQMVECFKRNNILLFDPLTINDLTENWEADQQGMMGGFLSQSVVTPEIDGAIRTSVVFAQRKDKNGMLEAYAVPDRLARYVETVNAYMDLRTKPNAEKRLAIVYFRGPGQSALVASGMEVVPSLFALLGRLKAEGYDLGDMPLSVEDFEREVKADQRVVYGNVALQMQPIAGEGKDEFQIVHGVDQDPPAAYQEAYAWIREDFKADALMHFGTHGSLEFTPRKQVALSSNDWPDRLVGSLPHFYLYTIDNVGECMTAKRRSYAQIVSHLTPPYHESRMSKQYKDLQEAMRQKDSEQVKALATELGLDRDLQLSKWDEADMQRLEDFAQEIMNEKVTGTPYRLGTPYAEKDIHSSVVAMTVDPIAYSRFNLDRLMGRVDSTVRAGSVEFERLYLSDARSLVERLYNGTAATDELIMQTAGISQEQLEATRRYVEERNAPKGMLAMMMAMARKDSTATDSTRKGKASKPSGMMAMMGNAEVDVPAPKNNPIAKFMRHQMRKMLAKKDPDMMLKVAKRMGASDEAIEKMRAALTKSMGEHNAQDTASYMLKGPRAYSSEGHEHNALDTPALQAIDQLAQAIANVQNYKQLLSTSPQGEIDALLGALNGSYTPPSPGGDPIASPNTLPTGRNLFAINAEETPTADAWAKGVELAKATIADYRAKHDGEYPRKVSFTLWSGEFITTGGATIAQVLYLLGVEPVRDRYGRVTDLKLIDDAELQRPRIDAVVQTSGQLRDLAASRLYLITRAVEMAAAAPKGDYDNMVKEGVDESERYLVDQGIAPKKARELAQRRVFGGLNGGYGSGIQSMVERGDLWETDDEVADRYINNMGAYYGAEDDWEDFSKEAFAAALTRTDMVVQPRQSNSWGALSLDHVYEFMGGMNLALRSVPGKAT